MSILSWAATLGSTLLLQGCSTPSEKFINTATELGYNLEEVDGTPYKHKLFANARALENKDIDNLHVYLDGDGTPWKFNTQITDDPTPRNPLILQLMKLDPAPAILLGRPCYYGLRLSQLCNKSLWTSNRYSHSVVNSMRTALERWMTARSVKHLTLIGFSGGGTLATLLASDLDKLKTVVTIAANLDVKAWSDLHGYQPPTGSLNPMTDAHLPPHVRQIHLAGLEDDNVPAGIVETFSLSQQNALYLPQAQNDHSCCWEMIWPDILKTYLDQ
ncbi:MAG: hypothetical protein PHH11_02855 [Methylomonas sp.]|nr:hypothetical protein [Methylomonas sp.]